MSDGIKVKFRGMKQLDRNIQRLPEELKKKAYRSVLSTGARVIAKHIKRNVPKDTGNLKKSIGIKVNPKAKTPWARIGPKRGVTTTVDGKQVRVTTYAKNVEQGTVHTAAQPYVRPGIDSSGSEVMTKMAAGLNRFMTRAVASARRGR